MNIVQVVMTYLRPLLVPLLKMTLQQCLCAVRKKRRGRMQDVFHSLRLPPASEL